MGAWCLGSPQEGFGVTTLRLGGAGPVLPHGVQQDGSAPGLTLAPWGRSFPPIVCLHGASVQMQG